jgi:NAD-dependent deacetylase
MLSFGAVTSPEDALRGAQRLFVITGAGASAESGISTFRDPGGWWKTRNPEDLATRQAFDRDPEEVWRWYDARRQMVANVEPNRTHLALAHAEASGRVVTIVTQNVDDLHERAGSREVIHVHGCIWRMRCVVEQTVFENRQVPLPVIPPRCPSGHLARPDIVWWDEDLDPTVVRRVEQVLEDPFDVALVIGTEATFDYVRDWARQAQARGARLIEVNPRQTALTPFVDGRLSPATGAVLYAVLLA